MSAEQTVDRLRLRRETREAEEMATAPLHRPRRLRRLDSLRRLVRETRLAADDLIYPLFVVHGQGIREEIDSMPGTYHWSLDLLPAEAEEVASLGIPGVILFGIPAEKDAAGGDALSESGIIARAIRVAKQAAPELLLVTDVCFCEYTDHGHCGPISDSTGRTDVDNDATLELLAEQAVVHARCGADMVAPSGMMDGMVGAIRRGLDAAGFSHLPIMSYAAKYASAFYGPFREAAESAPQWGNRRSYQMDPAAAAEQALREVARLTDDEAMVKDAELMQRYQSVLAEQIRYDGGRVPQPTPDGTSRPYRGRTAQPTPSVPVLEVH